LSTAHARSVHIAVIALCMTIAPIAGNAVPSREDHLDP
jgi:hypothetical protein